MLKNTRKNIHANEKTLQMHGNLSQQTSPKYSVECQAVYKRKMFGTKQKDQLLIVQNARSIKTILQRRPRIQNCSFKEVTVPQSRRLRRQLVESSVKRKIKTHFNLLLKWNEKACTQQTVTANQQRRRFPLFQKTQDSHKAKISLSFHVSNFKG